MAGPRLGNILNLHLPPGLRNAAASDPPPLVEVILMASDACRESFPEGPDQVVLGPWTFFQLTYDTGRSGPDGDRLGLHIGGGVWWYQGHAFSDLIVAPAGAADRPGGAPAEDAEADA